jgi:hypothetical protein
MSYIKTTMGGIWGRGTLPSITIPKKASGSFILPSRADPYWGYPEGRPYVGMRPPPSLIGKANPPFVRPNQNLMEPEFRPRPKVKRPPRPIFELLD